MRALLLTNPGARQGGSKAANDFLTPLRESGIEIVEADVSPSEYSAEIRRRSDKLDLVLVGGGDGSMNAAADGLVETNLPLGVLPLGTANDLARTLGIPADPIEAAKLVVAGKRRRIDLGWVNGSHFFNVASLGLTVSITRQLSSETKSRWGVFAYPLTALRVLWNVRPFHAEIRTNGETHRVHAVQIAVGNGRYYGGGMTIAEDAAIDDCRLDLYSLEVHRWWQVISLVPALRTGTHAGNKGVRVLRGREFEITTRRPRHINTDGEITTRTPAVFRVAPQAIEVFVPADAGEQPR
ncbi:MAG: lipid kinase [Gemmataceae bacterium]|nr:lipid kinase [Gemmataceae bacterium]